MKIKYYIIVGFLLLCTSILGFSYTIEKNSFLISDTPEMEQNRIDLESKGLTIEDDMVKVYEIYITEKYKVNPQDKLNMYFDKITYYTDDQAKIEAGDCMEKAYNNYQENRYVQP